MKQRLLLRIMGLERALRRARTALEAKDWPAAALGFRAAIEAFPSRVPPDAFRGLARAERELDRAELAEAALGQGLAAHPGHIDLVLDHAEMAILRGDRDEAVRRCERAVSGCGDDIRRTAMLRLAEVLLELGHHDDHRAWLEKAVELDPQDLELSLKLADLYYEAKDWANAARAYERYIRARGDAAELSAFFKLRSSLQQIGRMHDESVWLAMVSDAGRRAAASYRALLNGGDRVLATELFAAATSEWLNDTEVAALWQEAFACLADIVLPGVAEASPQSGGVERVPLRKLIVSGMGWSGSGAIYDFFREFPDVHAIKGEFKYIEGTPGLASLWKLSDDRVQFDRELVAFFGHALLGLDEAASQYAYLTAYQGRRFAKGPGRLRYARAVLDFMQAARKRLAGHAGAVSLNAFRAFATELIDGVPLGGHVPEGGIALLDNVVHIGQAPCIEFLEQTRIFCTFRDPRSNYAALVRECTGFSETPEAFVQRYRQQRQRYAQTFEGTLRGHPAVHLVQFEKFVLSEEFRRELAVAAGLSLDGWDKHEHFKPWVSEANVFLHEAFEDQKAISTIEQALPEYCIDVHMLKRKAE